ncbi:DUF2854 domain-containing protein [Anabaena cylindrica FACHB-243]|uniref:DUF2854 domain-containing protein n=1 Tax=Anabaena cylindrica (strain ATCC 27899 / PCC 7122) TaxID=272123 RepID=K9ZFK7_ANACC|nr:MULTISPECIES: DUF2854 domain-containing protein [Anabaena]AFZ57976.1 hypothetical protein Anacy_2531 [Anabaena cylindrica PCC 7122]MBD2420778.1 DUF2854 domain-containing protein [Anabaena cylindrica FACHB-243]MBY5282707.1 DUF2854 domain-containing protein [Anabaena sp. CCAP 1446/1C]MBY5307119.1 DUF2854 domain-containing protein [Anabaena sp. CCAP 1446/1C]MCM2408202.1 DUF2854 domain-containing protein [Anabaena sp. CCAP 1446/1C]
MLGNISLGTLGLTVGSILIIVGFVAYAADNASLNLVGFFYGFPLFLGGLALKANELKPIPFSQSTTPSVLELRKQQATVTQNRVRTDITRFCYGQEGHFDRALTYLGLSPSNEERPIVTGLRETEVNGAYCIILEFDSPLIPLDIWQEKHEKMTKYFAPNVEVKITQPSEDKIELELISTQQ